MGSWHFTLDHSDEDPMDHLRGLNLVIVYLNKFVQGFRTYLKNSISLLCDLFTQDRRLAGKKQGILLNGFPTGRGSYRHERHTARNNEF